MGAVGETAWYFLPVREQVRIQAASALWWSPSGVKVRAGEQYEIYADGLWYDASIECGPRGYASPSALFTALETRRRIPRANWFCLCAAVAGEDDLGSIRPSVGTLLSGKLKNCDRNSQMHEVGLFARLAVERDGWLYFFANDLPFMYGNNHGELPVGIFRLA